MINYNTFWSRMKELRHNGELGQKLYEDENGRHQTAYWLAGKQWKKKKKKRYRKKNSVCSERTHIWKNIQKTIAVYVQIISSEKQWYLWDAEISCMNFQST